MKERLLFRPTVQVSDINNFLKTDSEICMDFKFRLNAQAGTIKETQASPSASYNRLVAVVKKMDVHWQEMETLSFLEENY